MIICCLDGIPTIRGLLLHHLFGHYRTIGMTLTHDVESLMRLVALDASRREIVAVGNGTVRLCRDDTRGRSSHLEHTRGVEFGAVPSKALTGSERTDFSEGTRDGARDFEQLIARAHNGSLRQSERGSQLERHVLAQGEVTRHGEGVALLCTHSHMDDGTILTRKVVVR